MRHHGEGVVGNVKLKYVMGKEGENGNQIKLSNIQLTTSHQVWRTWAGDILHECCGHQTKCWISGTLSPRVALMENSAFRHGRYVAVTEKIITEQCSQAMGPGRLSIREVFLTDLKII